MILESNIKIVGNAYRVEIAIIELTPMEKQAIDRFGMPDVDVGGRIQGSATRPGAGSATAIDVTLPSALHKLPAGFPVVGVIAFDDYDDVDVVAKVWSDKILERVTDARDLVISRSQHFVGQTRTTV